MVERLEIARVDGAVVVDVQIGGRPGVVRTLAWLGRGDSGVELRLEALDFGLIPGSPGLGQLLLQVSDAVLEGRAEVGLHGADTGAVAEPLGELDPDIRRQMLVPIDRRSAEEQLFRYQPSPSEICRLRQEQQVPHLCRGRTLV